MSPAARHADRTEDSDRPTKRARVVDDDEEEESEDEISPSKLRGEPQKASDLYLDTVCPPCSPIARNQFTLRAD